MLRNPAKDEDEHKNWCDMELEKSNESKDSKDNRMELLDGMLERANTELGAVNTRCLFFTIPLIRTLSPWTISPSLSYRGNI